MRALPFIHRFHTPDDPDGSVLVLLHGTGGNEADPMPLAHRIALRATLLGVRGCSTAEGITRRFDAMTHDQADIQAGASIDARSLTAAGHDLGAVDPGVAKAG